MDSLNKVLITGTTGFVGRNLAGYLKRFNYSAVRLNLREPGSLNIGNCNTVIHLAGKAHDIKKVSDPKEYYDINLGLTRKVYDAFLKSEARKFIFISSVKAVADSVEGMLTESAEPDPQTHYGKSKLLAERHIQDNSADDAKAVYILRPCMIHGPGNKGNLNLLFNLISKGVPYPFAAFENKRSFLSVENLCFIIKEILERGDIPSGIYNVADDHPLSTSEVVALLAESLDRKPNLWYLPKWLIGIVARAGDLLRLPLNSDRVSKLTENYVVSNEKIKAALRKELPLSSQDGIMRTARSFTSPQDEA